VKEELSNAKLYTNVQVGLSAVLKNYVCFLEELDMKID